MLCVCGGGGNSWEAATHCLPHLTSPPPAPEHMGCRNERLLEESWKDLSCLILFICLHKTEV